MPGLPYLPGSGKEAVIPCLLHGKELVLQPEAGIAVQAGRHVVEKQVGQKEQGKEHKAENGVEQPKTPLLQNARIPRHDEKVQADKNDRQYPEHIPSGCKGIVLQELPCGMGGGIPGDDSEGAAHQKPEGCSVRGKGRRGLAADPHGSASEAGKDAAHGKEDADGFPARDLKRMHIEDAHDGGGREEQPEDIDVEKAAHSFPGKAQKEDKGDCQSRQLSGAQPQVLFHGEIGKQHPRQENHKLHCQSLLPKSLNR